jgi:hypothetical protein
MFGFYSYGQTCDIMVDAIKSESEIVMLSHTQSQFNNWGNMVATKIDGNGVTLWSQQYNNAALSIDATVPYKIYDATGDFYFILALVTAYDPVEQWSPSRFQLWKINKSNGGLVWRSSSFDGVQTYVEYEFIDYDANNVILVEPKYSSGGSNSGRKINLISKTAPSYSGTVIFEDVVSTDSHSYCKDSKGNLIFVFHQPNSYPAIKKINGIDFNTTLWKKTYNSGLPSEGLLPTIDYLFLDSSDSLYALSGEDNMDIYKINSNNGSVFWKSNNVSREAFVSDYKFKDNYLYLSFKHWYVGAVTTSFEIKKINISNGVLAWDHTSQTTILNMSTIGTPNSSDGTNEAILSFDFGCNNDIYATGYYASDNWQPAAWGIMRINDTNGTKINDNTIFNSHDQIVDFYSVGLGAYVIDGQVIFVGNLEYSQGNNVRTVVKTDTTLNSITSVQAPCSVLDVNQMEHSDAIEMHPNPTKGLVYFELNDNALLERVTFYSIEGKELNSWENTNSIDLYLYPDGMYLVKLVTDKKQIVVKKIIKN